MRTVNLNGLSLTEFKVKGPDVYAISNLLMSTDRSIQFNSIQKCLFYQFLSQKTFIVNNENIVVYKIRHRMRYDVKSS